MYVRRAGRRVSWHGKATGAYWPTSGILLFVTRELWVAQLETGRTRSHQVGYLAEM
jgi:hypothetical protein